MRSMPLQVLAGRRALAAQRKRKLEMQREILLAKVCWNRERTELLDAGSLRLRPCPGYNIALGFRV